MILAYNDITETNPINTIFFIKCCKNVTKTEY